ncbi:MAG: fatty acid desaturase [Planctomycetaceae bacterium]|nr:fatty acid desaturase [Planctomycetaceae bacterium]
MAIFPAEGHRVPAEPQSAASIGSQVRAAESPATESRPRLRIYPPSAPPPVDIRGLHVNDRAWMWPHTLTTLAYAAALVGGLWTWQQGYWPLTVACWLLGAQLGHMKLIALHESAHGTLNAHPLRNEVQGLAVASMILVPLSAFRYVHSQHHAYLATPRDLELWPYVNPETPRWVRILAVAAELTIGYFYTPVIFLRGVLVGENLPPRERRRIWIEYAAIAATWCVVLPVVAWHGWWTELAVLYLVPSILSGNLQSLRKFTEHLGLLGSSILETTRTVVDPSLIGTTFSEAMLHIDHHATHHRWAKMPHYNLPLATPAVYEGQPRHLPLFSSYAAAMLDMARSLGNPRIGRQWLAPQSPRLATEPELARARAA